MAKREIVALALLWGFLSSCGLTSQTDITPSGLTRTGMFDAHHGAGMAVPRNQLQKIRFLQVHNMLRLRGGKQEGVGDDSSESEDEHAGKERYIGEELGPDGSCEKQVCSHTP